jgi:hypothetical protein
MEEAFGQYSYFPFCFEYTSGLCSSVVSQPGYWCSNDLSDRERETGADPRPWFAKHLVTFSVSHAQSFILVFFHHYFSFLLSQPASERCLLFQSRSEHVWHKSTCYRYELCVGNFSSSPCLCPVLIKWPVWPVAVILNSIACFTTNTLDYAL